MSAKDDPLAGSCARRENVSGFLLAREDKLRSSFRHWGTALLDRSSRQLGSFNTRTLPIARAVGKGQCVAAGFLARKSDFHFPNEISTCPPSVGPAGQGARNKSVYALQYCHSSLSLSPKLLQGHTDKTWSVCVLVMQFFSSVFIGREREMGSGNFIVLLSSCVS